MAHGKMKTLHGLYKRIGREAFLAAAQHYSNHVHGSVETTVGELESRWYDAEHTMTEAEKMVEDYNNGVLLGYHGITAEPAGEEQSEENGNYEGEDMIQNDHPKLVGYSANGTCLLHSVQEVADFICREGLHGDLTIRTRTGDFFLNTIGMFVDHIEDMDYLERLLKVLVPMQMALCDPGSGPAL